MRQYAPGIGAGVFLERAVRRKATGAPSRCHALQPACSWVWSGHRG